MSYIEKTLSKYHKNELLGGDFAVKSVRISQSLLWQQILHESNPGDMGNPTGSPFQCASSNERAR